MNANAGNLGAQPGSQRVNHAEDSHIGPFPTRYGIGTHRTCVRRINKAVQTQWLSNTTSLLLPQQLPNCPFAGAWAWLNSEIGLPWRTNQAVTDRLPGNLDVKTGQLKQAAGG
jgi:hypothetical protein